MRLPLGLNSVSPRGLALSGLISATILLLTVVPDPIPLLQFLAAVSTVGSFVIAYLNWVNGQKQTREQEVVASGDSPHRVIQIMDSTVELSYPGDEDSPEDDPEEIDAESDDGGRLPLGDFPEDVLPSGRSEHRVPRSKICVFVHVSVERIRRYRLEVLRRVDGPRRGIHERTKRVELRV